MQLVPWAVGQLLDMAKATRGQRNIVGTVSVLATPHQCFELHKARTQATQVHHQGFAPHLKNRTKFHPLLLQVGAQSNLQI